MKRSVIILLISSFLTFSTLSPIISSDVCCSISGWCSAGQVFCSSGTSCLGLRACDCATYCCPGCGCCPPPSEVCDDGIDNDGDGYTDCADSDCNGQTCQDDGNPCTTDVCSGGICTHSPKCTSTQCCDYQGNCINSGSCGQGTEGGCPEYCLMGSWISTTCTCVVFDCVDEGYDGSCGDCSLTCLDGIPQCCYNIPVEICDDGIDNDGDGYTDCADSDCDGKTCQDDGNECTNDVCSGGVCTHPNVADGSDCSGTPGKCCSGVCDNDGVITNSDYHADCRSGPSCLAQGEWGYTAANDGNLCGGYNCRECSSGYCSSDDNSRCTGDCDYCDAGYCAPDNNKCPYCYQDCRGSGTTFNCYDFRPDLTNTCDYYDYCSNGVDPGTGNPCEPPGITSANCYNIDEAGCYDESSTACHSVGTCAPA